MLKCKIGNYGSKCILKTVVVIESKKLNCVNCANKIKNKIILTIRKGHGILIKLFRTTEMIGTNSKKEKVVDKRL